MSPMRPCPCGRAEFETVFEYKAPPQGEMKFGVVQGRDYYRRILRCANCGHFLSNHEMDMSSLYTGEYVDATYGEGGMRRAFERVSALPPERSDNAGRVGRIVSFVSKRLGMTQRPPAVLDVGAGLCVFLHRLQRETGWRCVGLDPDPRVASHGASIAGVRVVTLDFMSARDIGRFDLVTFNKVLEHVEDPVAMLARSKAQLEAGGVVYVEVPDGEAAVRDGPGREEFFIDHHHIFSALSLRVLARKAGFELLQWDRLKEPSGKYTLYAFMSVKPGSSA